jgi:hypothetical protein
MPLAAAAHPTRRGWVLGLLGCCLGARGIAATPAATATAALLGLDAAPAAQAARYAVTVTPPTARGTAGRRRADWFFFRSADRIAVLKGAIDETWTRDAQGRIAFERTFHDHAKVTDYSPGELLTLGLQPDWAALATFVDARELAGLQWKARSGHGASLRLRLEGRVGRDSLRVDWLPALQLPALVWRRSPVQGTTRIELLAHAQTAPAQWPQPGQRSANYLHLDAADFGDMDHDPVVRLSEALDVRSGWRQPHAHD